MLIRSILTSLTLIFATASVQAESYSPEELAQRTI
jgi:hypothetical protein